MTAKISGYKSPYAVDFSKMFHFVCSAVCMCIVCGCEGIKKGIGVEKTPPDEFSVSHGSAKDLIVPPFDILKKPNVSEGSCSSEAAPAEADPRSIDTSDKVDGISETESLMLNKLSVGKK
ncbi:hypothetical protein [Candidatus Hydrogenosomobacter endosymbioticus]|uniref:Uncharacterized protein n=1 Tax=Candidatus Hydrogenosomobacter endosymbioticus TaxID=2558174 RepID=A0ABM7V9I4_9PROT|nr:hypothetical protein [Candidatus Hydrogenosomobacter endosymbioticus]BDB96439.1 hypothetical protein HYD_5720 [Candidatus Hydrogenosomobacter endosymbioticus]